MEKVRTTESAKWCKVCQQYKPHSEFYKSRKGLFGIVSNNLCKLCYPKGKYDKEYQHNYYMEHKEELLPKHNVSAKLSIQHRKLSLASSLWGEHVRSKCTLTIK